VSAETPSNGWGLTHYFCAPTMTWVQDANQTFLVDADGGRFWSLRGVEAAIWDLLSLGYGYEKVARFLSLMLRVSEDEAESALSATLRRWQDEGIVQVMRDSGHGQPGN
jgi:hypothetical protein